MSKANCIQYMALPGSTIHWISFMSDKYHRMHNSPTQASATRLAHVLYDLAFYKKWRITPNLLGLPGYLARKEEK